MVQVPVIVLARQAQKTVTETKQEQESQGEQIGLKRVAEIGSSLPRQLKSRAINCGPLSDMIRGLASG